MWMDPSEVAVVLVFADRSQVHSLRKEVSEGGSAAHLHQILALLPHDTPIKPQLTAQSTGLSTLSRSSGCFVLLIVPRVR